MEKKIKLKPGYDPTKYRDEIRAELQKNRGSMTFEEHMKILYEETRKLYAHKEFIRVPDRTTNEKCDNNNGKKN